MTILNSNVTMQIVPQLTRSLGTASQGKYMFNNNLVMAIKVNGKVLREFDGTVALPFGSEYSILIKNLSTRKAAVKINIDGSDVTENIQLIIEPKSDLDLKRFIKDGNLEAGNAFKFIKKTDKIEKYRGNKAEDGLITVTYEFEREYVPYVYKPPKYFVNPDQYWLSNGGHGIVDCSDHTIPSCTYSSTVITRGALQSSIAMNDAGITAPGSIVEQKFNSTYGFVSDGIKHSMTLQLKGEVETVQGAVIVQKAVTVKKLQRCKMCGTDTKQTAKFCHECGASVQIV